MRVVLADDSLLLREGLELVLRDAGHEIVGSAADGPSYVETALRERPDLSIVDVRMPPSHTDEGLRAALEVRQQWPQAAILVLSQYVERSYAAELMATGVESLGYLLKDRVSDIDSFLASAESVAGGGTALDPFVVAQLLATRPQQDPVNSLTPREREVLGLMAEGLSNTAIAARLVVTEGAVEKHVSRIFDKLGLYADEETNRRVRAVLAYLGT